MTKKALIVWGGWDGHQPKEVAELLRGILAAEGFDVEVSDTLEAFADKEKLTGLDLIVPAWTMGKIEQEWVNNISAAVQAGTGLAGCHGGMCDAFRENTDWQFMTGGQWVAHPGNDGTEYVVNVKHSSSPLVAGISDFTVSTEQYYLHVDPANEVLATTRFPVALDRIRPTRPSTCRSYGRSVGDGAACITTRWAIRRTSSRFRKCPS